MSNGSIDEAKYKKWFRLDTLLIVFMWCFLVLSESFVTFTILYAGISRGLEIPMILLVVFGVVLFLMFFINGMACLNVWRSIKAHMYEFKYYD
ncbi:hypothetical protein MmiHf6_09290 [Methanimicrococcus hongohii]|uniref:DUF4282 domain-containing protein n=1 Tax=Methanimicrococcus hongohii TaxID=3028295 RepID=A0AA96V0C9_9EURY|nr:monomethylamine permease [Methanimicrococcus sp. Hf6]WNY23620.1 hypothetical protein MmiHf6_09290 [Methanimicrococcus sp. Hf6]